MSSRVNEVNGENLQDPPNQKSWLRQCSEEHKAFFAETRLQLQRKERPYTRGGQHLDEAFQSCRQNVADMNLTCR